MDLREKSRLSALIVALSGITGTAIASGSATPPLETKFSANIRCGFGESELIYSNTWNPEYGHRSHIRELILNPSNIELNTFETKRDEIEKNRFRNQEIIEKVTTSCYEENSFIYNIYILTLKIGENGRLAWQPAPTIHLDVGPKGISFSSSSGK